jgi:hypothetical protein
VHTAGLKEAPTGFLATEASAPRPWNKARIADRETRRWGDRGAASEKTQEITDSRGAHLLKSPIFNQPLYNSPAWPKAPDVRNSPPLRIDREFGAVPVAEQPDPRAPEVDFRVNLDCDGHLSVQQPGEMLHERTGSGALFMAKTLVNPNAVVVENTGIEIVIQAAQGFPISGDDIHPTVVVHMHDDKSMLIEQLMRSPAPRGYLLTFNSKMPAASCGWPPCMAGRACIRACGSC